MKPHRTHISYITGFILSVFLTLVAYLLVSQRTTAGHQTLPSNILILILAGLAAGQLLVQLGLFLHVGSEPKPRWNLMATLFSFMVVIIVVGGSLWIMNNLNYNMMSPSATDKAIMHDEGIHK